MKNLAATDWLRPGSEVETSEFTAVKRSLDYLEKEAMTRAQKRERTVAKCACADV